MTEGDAMMSKLLELAIHLAPCTSWQEVDGGSNLLANGLGEAASVVLADLQAAAEGTHAAEKRRRHLDNITEN